MTVGEPWESLDRYLAGETTLDELLHAVLATPFDERSVPEPVAARLRSLASPPPDVDRARWSAAVARDAYELGRPGRLVLDRVTRLARGIVDGTINPAAGARALARQRADGIEWIPEAFAGLVAELEKRPPRATELGERLAGERAAAARLRPAIIVAARRLLEAVERV